MGARRRRINKERVGIFGAWRGDDDEESGGAAAAKKQAQKVAARTPGGSSGGIPLVVWGAWAVVGLVIFLLFRYQHLLH